MERTIPGTLSAAALVLALGMAHDVASATSSRMIVLPPLGLSSEGGRLPGPSTIGAARVAIEEACAEVKCSAPGWSESLDAVKPVVPPTPGDIAELRDQASAALRDVDYQSAIRRNRQLVEAVEQRLAEVGDVTLLIEAHLGLAQLYLSRREKMLVQSSLERVARLRPGLSLDLRRHPPQLVERFEQVKARVATEPKAELALSPRPDGAAVFVDGISVGQSPLSAKVAQGVHLVWIGAPGHVPELRRVELEPGSRVVVDVNLREREDHALRGRLRQALERGAERAELTSLATSLAGTLEAEALVVTGVAQIEGGTALVAVLATEPDAAVVGRLDPALNQAAPLLVRMLQHLGSARSGRGEGVEELQATGAPDELSGLDLDFKRYLLGAAPGVIVTTTGAEGTSPQTPVHVDEEDGLLSSPWFWIGSSAALLVIAGGVAGSLAFLLQPDPEVIEEPDRTTLDVEVVP